MRIALLNYDYLALPTAMQLLTRFAPLQWQAEGLHQAGAGAVHVFQRFHTAQDFTHNGVAYHFWADGLPNELRLAHRPSTLHRAVGQLQPDVVHAHGLVFPLQAAALRRSLPAHTALVLQQHSELPGHPVKRVLQRLCFRGVDAFLFPTAGMAVAWQRARIVSTQPTHILQETSRLIQPADKAAARAITHMTGDPALLWMARLVPAKDPLTVLSGFEQVASTMPEIKLYMGHGCNDPLLESVRERIARSAVLQRSVVLLGEVARADLDAYDQSADYFVSGSTRYGGIIALLEAMGCGAAPIVTDTEAFRSMTDDGRLGRLWKVGDANAFAHALGDAIRDELHVRQRTDILSHFQEHLSLPVLSQRSLQLYAQAVSARQQHRGGHGR